jgi:hypothetical protein
MCKIIAYIAVMGIKAGRIGLENVFYEDAREPIERCPAPSAAGL